MQVVDKFDHFLKSTNKLWLLFLLLLHIEALKQKPAVKMFKATLVMLTVY